MKLHHWFISISLIALPLLAAASGGNWTRGPHLPTPRSEAAAAVLDGQIYVIGGLNQMGRADRTVEVYDPSTERWAPAPPLPEALHHAGAAVVGSDLFVVGGFTQGWKAVDSVWRYNKPSGWQKAHSMPTARGALGVVSVNGRIYAIGGREDEDTSANEVFDPATGRWTVIAAMPTPRNHFAVADVGGKIYAIGGRRGRMINNLAVVEVYDPVEDTWQRAAPLPTARSGISAAALDSKIFVLGGESVFRTFFQNEAFDTAAQRWESDTPLPTARHGLGVAAYKGRIFAIGGGTEPGGSVSSLLEIFRP